MSATGDALHEARQGGRREAWRAQTAAARPNQGDCEQAVGSDEIWDKATSALREALGAKGWEYDVDEGGGAAHVCGRRVACG